MENLDICKKCGGFCCKKSGCDYLPRDFSDLSFNGLYQKLQEGNISIVASLGFEKLPNGKLIANPFLYLRARNKNREIIDLFSMKTTCSMLTEGGCSYSHNERPFMGKNLVPASEQKCFPLEDPNKLMDDWMSYQKVLSKIVKRMTGMTVEEKLSEDVEQLFMDLLTNNVDGVSLMEIQDVRSMIGYLSEIYQKELNSATQKITHKVMVKK